ncbi:ATP-binding protein [Paenibacillus wynnii]|uniref:ATP-binding protein n=1 Tax=Paenibacillus wynnii TaxID=268407 RepID=UPI002791B350|nr:ATP-binding protein [Paenibacillus wynnii]MDQ0196556.1 signal transduction histidine kinase [Paenibacillus wynnii]
MERATVLTDEVDIEAYRQNCFHAGIDPEQPPFFAERFSAEELEAQLIKYKEVIEVIDSFVNKFLSSVSGSPILIAISDAEGYLLAFKGDPTIIDTIRLVGIQEGVRFTEKVGINSINLCLRYQKPFQLVGQDHFHHILHGLVCCTAPFYKEDEQELLGTISFMTDIDAAHPHLLPLLCTMADSIERELLLRKGNAQFQLLNQILLETNYLGVIITDELGTIVNINDNAAEMLHIESDRFVRILGTSAFDINDLGDYFRRVVLQQEECNGVELTLERKGSAQHYIIDAVRVYDAKGSLSRAIVSLRNITEMKKTEEVLRNTEKLVFAGELAMSIAHEIRNPLTTIKGMLQLSNKNSQLLHYNLIMSEVERVNLIVSEFLILGKPQAVQFKKERCSTILQEVLSIFAFQANMNMITLNTQVKDDSEIECDRNQIKQVFLNLLRNSVEALPFGGMISIELNIGDGFQTIKFSDNGEGMSHEVLQNIGMAFHTTRTNGNGLGMMIVKKIVSAHRGHVEITSEVGVGTIVTIYLPT